MTINTNDLLNSILDSLSRIDHAKLEALPDINLYMDQVITFMEKELYPTKRHEEDPILTKTMVNNYVKNNLLPPPEFEIKKPKSILAQDTIACMQAGLVYGQIGQTEYIVKQMKKEFGKGDIKVVATGGLGRIIEKDTDAIDIYDPMLTLQGMRLIFEKQKK